MRELLRVSGLLSLRRPPPPPTVGSVKMPSATGARHGMLRSSSVASTRLGGSRLPPLRGKAQPDKFESHLSDLKSLLEL